MTYRLRFTPAVNKQISKLDMPVAARIKRLLVGLDLTNPR
jgi:mRNA-degrading endonuclease RelE of RelBE toxin-antitoxin system